MERHSPTYESNEGAEKIKPLGIISGSPGIGKSWFAEKLKGELSVRDMDPTPYRDTDRKNWPHNYINDILKNAQHFDLLLISAHPEIVEALRESGHEVTVVCADESLKEEYRERFIERNNDAESVERMLSRFTSKAENLSNYKGSKVIFLQKGQHLSDIIDLSK